MDREPEQRRDLAPAQPAPNPMGGELFVITEKRYFSGKPLVIQVRREQMVGKNSDKV